MKRFLLVISLVMIVISCAAYRSRVEIVSQKDFTFYKNSKIAISSIDGGSEAVGLLKNSLISSLFDMYIQEKNVAGYNIEGNVSANRYRRKGPFMFFTVNLRVSDKQGNIVMTVKSKHWFWESELDKFTDKVADSIRRLMVP